MLDQTTTEPTARNWRIDIPLMVSEQLCVTAATTWNRDATLVDDLGADSIDMVEMVLWIEHAIGSIVPDDAAECFLTVGNLIDYCTRATPAPIAATSQAEAD